MLWFPVTESRPVETEEAVRSISFSPCGARDQIIPLIVQEQGADDCGIYPGFLGHGRGGVALRIWDMDIAENSFRNQWNIVGVL